MHVLCCFRTMPIKGKKEGSGILVVEAVVLSVHIIPMLWYNDDYRKARFYYV